MIFKNFGGIAEISSKHISEYAAELPDRKFMYAFCMNAFLRDIEIFAKISSIISTFD